MKFHLDKRLWTEDDFEQMGWHDCRIYQIRIAGNELELDIDYILQWNQLINQAVSFTFWISPATLVFDGLSDTKLHLDMSVYAEIEIAEIHKHSTVQGICWHIETNQGSIEFVARGYKQYIRQEPFLQFSQVILLDERNGTCLDRTIEQQNPFRTSPEMMARRKNQEQAFQIANSRYQEKLNLEKLLTNRASLGIDTKNFLQEKRKLEGLLEHYAILLKGTLFENQ